MRFTWYEDLLRETGDSIYAMRRLVCEIDTPVLGLEHSRTEPFGAFNHMLEDALDIVRLDAYLGGGLTGALKTLHAAKASGFDVEPHFGGPVHLHLLACVTNARYFEHGLLHPEVAFEQINNVAYEGEVECIDEDGTIAVSEGSGLGIEIDWDYLDEHGTETRTFRM